LKKIRIEKLLTNGKALFLAYDQGLEHGPIDFNEHNIDPNYLLYIALNGGFNGVILQKGIAEKYHENYTRKIPLIVKLNGKTSIPKIFPIAKQLCSVKKAVDLGADAVGYTIFVGSPLEPEIFKNFSKIQEEAHDYGLPVIAWMYPRGRFVTNELNTSILAYSARVGLELGADILKIKYNDKPEEYEWVVKCAGNAKVMAAGGPQIGDLEFLQRARDVIDVGCSGMAIGREIWKHNAPLKMAAAVKSIIFENASPEEAIQLLE
jgi:class I fructose-bisphosphate aldolase